MTECVDDDGDWCWCSYMQLVVMVTSVLMLDVLVLAGRAGEQMSMPWRCRRADEHVMPSSR